MGVLEGIEDRIDQEIEEYGASEAAIACVIHEFSVSILEQSQDTLQIWLEDTPKGLGTGINLHLVDDEDEILNGGRIIAVKFKDTTDHDDIEESQEAIHSEEEEESQEAIHSEEESSETGPAIVTVEKWQYEIVEYSGPEDGPMD